jgi:hypothetical protein
MLMIAVTTNAAAKECAFKTIIDTDAWYVNYNMPEAKQIFLKQIAGDYMFYDSYKIVVQYSGDKSNLQKGQSLYQAAKYLGKVGTKSFERLDGFMVEKDVYVPLNPDGFNIKCKSAILGNYRSK